jgi:predicted NBD/HSP70 family sugar kinase
MQHSRPNARRHVRADNSAADAKMLGLRSVEIADRNFRVILEAIRRHGPLTRLELAHRSGLTGPGITNVLRRLSDGGLVTSRRRKEPVGGASSTEFALHPDGAFSIGIRLNGTRGEAVLLDLSGQVRNRVKFAPTGDLSTAIEQVVLQLTCGREIAHPILGVGIAAGPAEDVSFDELSSKLQPLRVLVERECVAAVLAERTIGTGVPEGGLVMIVIDDHVQAGLLVRGVPFAGVHGRAGSIGAMRTGPDHVRLDSVVGLRALQAVLTKEEFEILAAGEELPLSPALIKWVKSAASHLLDAIVAMAGFVAPGAILIGGDLPRNVVEALIHQLSIERRDTSIRPFSTPWISPIRPASFSGAGIAMGAALLPFFDVLLPSPATA